MNNDKVDTLLKKALRSSETPDTELIQKVKCNLILIKEEPVLRKKFSVRTAVVVAVFVLSLTLVGFAYGDQIIQLLGGGYIEEGKDANGGNYISIDTGFVNDPIEVRDGQIYFVLDGSNTNITDQCSEKTYYQYETVDNDGYRHVVLIGGIPDNVGMAEYIWDANGTFKGSNASYNSREEPAWLASAREAFDVN
jgi:hypothetical protein